jgi:NADPH:quinone reductase-like Zn-dependent oxidoreductase
MKALILKPATTEVAVEEIPVPEPAEGEVLIRVRAIALNPVDEVYATHPIAQQEKRVVGTDFAGEVVGSHDGLAQSTDERTRTGARVAGFLQGGT